MSTPETFWVDLARKHLTKDEFALFIERSAIMEFEGLIDRKQADRLAYSEAIELQQKRQRRE